MEDRIYLDNAATSWPKPPGVAEAMARSLELGGSYGRGKTRTAEAVRREVDRVRRKAAALFGCGDAARVVFTGGGTEGVNLVLRGLLSPGDRVLTTSVEHSAVYRTLESVRGLDVQRLPVTSDGRVDLEAAGPAFERPAAMLVMTHASNVTGAVQPAAELSAAAKKAGAVVVLDACQTVGHFEVTFDRFPDADVFITSGHKGPRGPLGTGLVAFGPNLDRLPRPLRFGGTGSRSEEETHPTDTPGCYEAGSMNVPGVFGLGAAFDVLEVGAERERTLTTHLAEGLASLPGVRIVGPPPGGERTPVVSVAVDGWDPGDLASILDGEFGVETRSGLHCAAAAHKALGTYDLGGTLRFSPSHHTSDAEIDAAIDAVRQILG